jgi:hypothetical protein
LIAIMGEAQVLRATHPALVVTTDPGAT